MAIHIRLTRRGAKKAPHYRIVVADQRCRRDGSFLEKIGIYNPADDTGGLVVDKLRLEFWQGRGAQLSHTVETLLKKQASADAAKA